MHESIDESPIFVNRDIYAFYGAKMRNFGEPSMSCLSSIHFLGSRLEHFCMGNFQTQKLARPVVYKEVDTH
jgi:hypothetical protein